MKIKTLFTYVSVVGIIFSMLCGGSFRIGPLSLRNYVTVYLLLYVFLNRGSVCKNSILSSYVVFFLVMIFCAFINGDALCVTFWTRTIISYFIPSFLAFYSVNIFCNREKSGVNVIGNVLLGLFVINAVITILQYYGNPVGWNIARVLSSGDLQSEDVLERIDGDNSFSGIAVATGLFGFVTGNGYFIGSYLPVATRRILDKSKIQLIIGILVLALSAYAAFATQERMALLSVICYVLLILYYNFKNSKSSTLIIVFVLVCSILYLSINVTDYGRFSFETDNSDRQVLLRAFSEFLQTDYVWFGGWSEYMRLFPGLNQHNTFMDTITRYGVVGVIVFFFVFGKLCIFTIQNLIYARRSRNISRYIYSSGVLLYLFYSMTHGTGLQSGDVLFWLLFALLVTETNKQSGLCYCRDADAKGSIYQKT